MNNTNATKKYEVRVCKCGRIHLIEWEKIDNAIKNNKNILLICAGCGAATEIGATIEPDLDDPNKVCYMMYTTDFSAYKDRILTEKDFDATEKQEKYKGIEEAIYSHGYKVPMMNGEYANEYYGGRFADTYRPNFSEIQRHNITVEEIMEFIEKYTRDRTTVCMNRFINETPDEVLEAIAQRYIEGLNFKDTKWENEWNSKS